MPRAQTASTRRKAAQSRRAQLWNPFARRGHLAAVAVSTPGTDSNDPSHSTAAESTFQALSDFWAP
eukprot:7946589-Pyramimonas_sp.AAC.1